MLRCRHIADGKSVRKGKEEPLSVAWPVVAGEAMSWALKREQLSKEEVGPEAPSALETGWEEPAGAEQGGHASAGALERGGQEAPSQRRGEYRYFIHVNS